MSKNLDTQTFVREFMELARSLKRAEAAASTRFQAIVDFVKTSGMADVFVKPIKDLTKEQREIHEVLKARMAKLYGWEASKISNNWRQFKLRVKRELAESGAVAQQSREQRQRAKADAKRAKADAKRAKADAKAKRQPRTPQVPDAITVAPSRLMKVAESIEAAMRLATSDTQKAYLADALAILSDYIGFEA